MTAEGPVATEWIGIAQTFAGPPGPTRPEVRARERRRARHAVDPRRPRSGVRREPGRDAVDDGRGRASFSARPRQVEDRRHTSEPGPAGKMPMRERVALLLDRDSPFLELSPLAGYRTDYTVGGGAVAGVGVISGTECALLGNDPSVMGGAMTAISIRKLLRALEVARQNRLPYVQLVESAGGDLRGGGGGGDPRGRAAPEPRSLLRDRSHVPRHHRAVGIAHPDGVDRVRQLDGRRRLSARPVRLQHLRSQPGEGLPRRTAAREGGDRRGRRRRGARRRRDARHRQRPRRLPRRGRARRHPHGREPSSPT